MTLVTMARRLAATLTTLPALLAARLARIDLQLSIIAEAVARTAGIAHPTRPGMTSA